jgi:hypothetical protein
MRQNSITKLEHIGAARIYANTLRIDVKRCMAMIPRSGIKDVVAGKHTLVYDVSDVYRRGDVDHPIGRAWRTENAVMYEIDGRHYCSPYHHVIAVLVGERKYAAVSEFVRAVLSAPSSLCEVTA